MSFLDWLEGLFDALFDAILGHREEVSPATHPFPPGDTSSECPEPSGTAEPGPRPLGVSAARKPPPAAASGHSNL